MSNLPVLYSDGNLTSYLEKVNKIPSLTQEEEFLYAKNFLEKQDLEAAHMLVKSHLKLVVKIAMRYRGYGLPVQDLISEGNIGLMQSVKKFDPDLGFRLSTYSTWWIKASIQEYILKSWSLVKIGTTAAQKKLFFGLNKARNKIRALCQREVNADDNQQIAQMLSVSESDVVDMNQRLSGGDLSLNKLIPGRDGSSSEMINLLPAAQQSQEEVMSTSQLSRNKKQILSLAMSQLNEREANILAERKLQENPTTLDILSNKYKISKERIRQIESKAFEKVQSYVLAHCSADGQMKTI